MDTKTHWSQVYQSKALTDVSWYQAHPQVSLDLITSAGIEPGAHIIDVGAGASLLADHLLALGFQHLTLLDVSGEALAAVRDRLGEAADAITFIEDDVTRVALPSQYYDLWHDRAVFHFLTDPAQRQAYIAQVQRSLRPGGHVIVATFAPDGPERCSGLTVARYDAVQLHSAFGSAFVLVRSLHETHHTPWGSEQQFTYCYCRMGDTA